MNLDDKKGSGEFGQFELTKEMMQYIYDRDHKRSPTREEYAELVRAVNSGAVKARYNTNLELFLENNALATEKDFIEYAVSDADIWIDLYQTEVDLMADPFDTDPDKRTYWFYKSYKDYLSQKLNALTNSQSNLIIEEGKEKMQARSVALIHYYLFINKEGEDINDSNVDQIAKNWGCAPSTLTNRFGEINSEGAERYGKVTKKKPRKEQFELILNYLKENNYPNSFKIATVEYNRFLDNNDFPQLPN